MRARCLGPVIVLIAACAPHAAQGPAWPKPHATEHDGGESLAPHAAGELESESRGDDVDEHPVVAAPVGTPAQAAVAPSTTTPEAPAQAGEPKVLEGDEIIIEVDE